MTVEYLRLRNFLPRMSLGIVFIFELLFLVRPNTSLTEFDTLANYISNMGGDLIVSIIWIVLILP